MKKIVAAMMICFVIGSVASEKAEAEHIWLRGGYLGTRTQYGIQEFAHGLVHIGVWPVAPGHSVGLVYTLDGWQTAKWGEAGWRQNVQGLGGMDESWTFDGGYYMWETTGYPYPLDMEFALYVSDQWGNWFWDNNGGMNHHLYYSN